MCPTISIFDVSEPTMQAIAGRTDCNLIAERWKPNAAAIAGSSQPTDSPRGIVYLGAVSAADQTWDWIRSGDQILWLASAIRDLQLIDSLEGVCNHRSAYLELGNPLATSPGRSLVLGQLRSGKLGEPGVIRIHRWCCTPTWCENPALQDSIESALLRFELDFIQQCYQRLPVQVYATWQSDHRGLVIHLKYAGGQSALLDFQPKAHGDYASLSLIGSLGSATIDDQQNNQLVASDGQVTSHRAEDAADPTAHMVVDFLHRRFGSASPKADRVGLESWRATLQILRAVTASLDQGDVISMT